MRLVGSAEELREGWLGSHREHVPDGCFSGWGIPQRSVGSKPKLGSPDYRNRAGKGTQITSGCEKQWGFCTPGGDGWSCRELLKGPMDKIVFAATYPGLQQVEGRVD